MEERRLPLLRSHRLEKGDEDSDLRELAGEDEREDERDRERDLATAGASEGRCRPAVLGRSRRAGCAAIAAAGAGAADCGLAFFLMLCGSEKSELSPEDATLRMLGTGL
jgi:hypothetical protein